MDFFHPANADEEKFCRHIADLISQGNNSYYPRFSAFLTEREQQLAKTAAEAAGAEYSLWGGHEEAARKMFSSPAAQAGDFPLDAVTFTFRSRDKLSHRDFLGALMSLGIRRDQLGDISVSEGAAVVFASKTAVPLILTEIEKVGRVGVTPKEGINTEIAAQEFEEITAVLSSCRIDAVASAACKISREKAAALIKSGSVVVNGVQCLSVSQCVKEETKFSVKGYGKFILSQLGAATKKGKTHAIIKKFK